MCFYTEIVKGGGLYSELYHLFEIVIPDLTYGLSVYGAVNAGLY